MSKDTVEIEAEEKIEVEFSAVKKSGRVYTDQTVRFPVTSSHGTKYTMVVYIFNDNAIIIENIRDR